jgi:hypothetical protein
VEAEEKVEGLEAGTVAEMAVGTVAEEDTQFDQEAVSVAEGSEEEAGSVAEGSEEEGSEEEGSEEEGSEAKKL